MMHHIALCCLESSTSKDGFFFYHGLNGLNEVVLWRKEEIKTKQLPLAVQNEPPAEATDGYLRRIRSLSYGVLPSRQQSAICSIIVLTLVAPSGRIYMIYLVTQGVASLCPGL